MLKIFVASDHAGFDLKNQIIEYLIAKSFSIVDYGCYSSDSADYPDYAHPLAYDL